MPIAPGTRLGPYEVGDSLGAGGMGEVYRAKDTRLGREVAVKILPQQLADSPEARQRFEREARAVAGLSHPNICALYDVGSQDGLEFIVMELLTGETLAQRLLRGPVKIDELQRVGVEIADGLQKAHQQGIVHRDLKPANVMLTRTGAKLMDFGLAKPSAGLSHASDLLTPSGPTMSVAAMAASTSSPLTQKGMIVGTFQYIAPEVLQGKEADARSDIFSFGCVLFEMATARRAFEGKSQLSVFTAILEQEPEPVSSIQPLAPKALDSIVRNCLAKEPDERYSSAHDVKLQLRALELRHSSAAIVAPPPPQKKRRFLLPLLATVGVLVLAGLAYLFGTRRTGDPNLQLQILPPDKIEFNDFGDNSGPPALSPQGDRLAFTGLAENSPKALWIRDLDSFSARRIEGTEDAAHPFWSPDGRYLGFFAEGKLKKVLATGGPVVTLGDAPNPRGGTWCSNDVIVYEPQFLSALLRVNATGGPSTPATVLDPGRHTTHRWPVCMPDGKHFLYFATSHQGSEPGSTGIYFAKLDTNPSAPPEPTASVPMLATDGAAQYASGYLLFHSQSGVMAQPFDPAAGKLSGEPIPVLDKVRFDIGVWRALFTVSNNGRLAYVPGTTGAVGTHLQWFDRSGKSLGQPQTGSFASPRLSPDNKLLAFSTGDPSWQIAVQDLARDTRTRITFDQNIDMYAAWSLDGKAIVYCTYSATKGMKGEIKTRLANGAGAERVLVSEPGSSLLFPQFTPDGRYIAFIRSQNGRGVGVFAKPLSGDGPIITLVADPGSQADVQSYRISPNGKWIAYHYFQANQTGLYVAPLLGGEGRWQAASSGYPVFPSWSADGKQLFYITTSAEMYSVSVTEIAGGLQLGPPQRLFQTVAASIGTIYDVTSDGQKFVINTAGGNGHDTLNLMTNWTSQLKR